MKLTTNNKLHTAIINGMKSGAVSNVKGWHTKTQFEFECANLCFVKGKEWVFETTNPHERSQWRITPNKAFFNLISCAEERCVDVCFEDGTFENIENEQMIIDKIDSWDIESFEFN